MQTRTEWRSLSTVEIDSNAASITVATIPAGRRFYVLDLALQVEADGTLQLRSGSTDLTGPMNLLAASGIYRFTNQGFPVFTSAAAGDNFVIVNSGPVQVNGWVLIAEVPE